MNLKMYLAKENLKLKDFAKTVGIHPNYLSRLMHGRMMPGKRLAAEISRITGNQVKMTHKEGLFDAIINEPEKILPSPITKENFKEASLTQMTIYDINRQIDGAS